MINMPFAEIQRWVETIRYLRRDQIQHRLRATVRWQARRVLGRRWDAALTKRAKHTAGPAQRKEALGGFALLAEKMFVRRPWSWHASEPGAFTFLNDKIDIGFPPRWNDPQIHWARDPFLWRFHLHYFDWLWDILAADRAEDAIAAMRDWVEQNPLNVARAKEGPWSPYTISLRLWNWMAALACLRVADRITKEDWTILCDSIRRQALFLAENVEWEHRGNHLLENLSALIAARMFSRGRRRSHGESSLWKALLEQCEEQIGAGGMHAEGSAMYHALLLGRLLDLKLVLKDSEDGRIAELDKVIRRMGEFLAHIRCPDGEIPLLADSTGEVAQGLDALLEQCAVEWHNQSSERDHHVVFRTRHRDYLLFDAAPLGLDYLGAHMHADLMNVQVCIGERRIITSGGAGIYREGPERDAERATREHATITVDGICCADPWKSFRTGRRGHVTVFEANMESNPPWATARHDGFAPADVLHERRVTMEEKKRAFEIKDRLHHLSPELPASDKPHIIEAFWPLHPGVVATVNRTVVHIHCRTSGKALARLHPTCEGESVSISLPDGIMYEAFGKPSPRQIVVIRVWLKIGHAFTMRIEAAEGNSP
ncbi:N/A [soil metagenome]